MFRPNRTPVRDKNMRRRRTARPDGRRHRYPKEKLVALNKRSRVITEGDARSANRAMLYPVGFTTADFGKPIVGIAHGHSTMNPCNTGIGSLVDRAVAAVKQAGGMPQTWGFPTGSDGISMGTEGMRYSLPSREEIARCIQIGWGSHQMDGLLGNAGGE